MTVMLATNIILAAAIFLAVVGSLTWAIRTQARDGVATPSIADAALPRASRPAAHRPRPRTAAPKLTSQREVARTAVVARER